MKKSIAFALALIGAVSFGACCNNAKVSAASCPPCETAAKAAVCGIPDSAAGSSASDSTVIASYAGKTMTMAELDKVIAKDLFTLRQQALEMKIVTELVEAEAKKAGKAPEEFLREIAESTQAGAISDEQLHAVYEQLKPRLGDKSFEDVKPMIEGMLKQDLQKKTVMDYIEGLKKNADVKILLSEPRVEVAAVGPSKGPADAPVTIVEFSDFECPHCARAAATIEQVFKANEGKIKLVFRAFPLPFHSNAAKASEAALCANEQGKFWEMHDAFFADQDKLGVASLKETAKEKGLDSALFDTCLDSGKYAGEVQNNIKEGSEAGVDGTPAFVINGRIIGGARSFDDFQKIITEELNSKK